MNTFTSLRRYHFARQFTLRRADGDMVGKRGNSMAQLKIHQTVTKQVVDLAAFYTRAQFLTPSSPLPNCCAKSSLTENHANY
jgi:hypothetical protein